jgi:hypothetical protein
MDPVAPRYMDLSAVVDQHVKSTPSSPDFVISLRTVDRKMPGLSRLAILFCVRKWFAAGESQSWGE